MPRGFLQHQPRHRIRAAERLEAAETEAKALVLDVHRADAELGRKRGQRVQRRLGILVATSKITLGLGGAFQAQRLGIRRVERRAVVGVAIEQEHQAAVPSCEPFSFSASRCRSRSRNPSASSACTVERTYSRFGPDCPWPWRTRWSCCARSSRPAYCTCPRSIM